MCVIILLVGSDIEPTLKESSYTSEIVTWIVVYGTVLRKDIDD
jgi:hypothetical protein